MLKIKDKVWIKARLGYETIGLSLNQVAKISGISRKAVQLKAREEKWNQNVTTHELREKVAEHVAGLASHKYNEEQPDAIKSEIDIRAQILKTHRNEAQAIRALVYSALNVIKASPDPLTYSETLKSANTAANTLANVHRMERMAYGLDEPIKQVNNTINFNTVQYQEYPDLSDEDAEELLALLRKANDPRLAQSKILQLKKVA